MATAGISTMNFDALYRLVNPHYTGNSSPQMPSTNPTTWPPGQALACQPCVCQSSQVNGPNLNPFSFHNAWPAVCPHNCWVNYGQTMPCGPPPWMAQSHLLQPPVAQFQAKESNSPIAYENKTFPADVFFPIQNEMLAISTEFRYLQNCRGYHPNLNYQKSHDVLRNMSTGTFILRNSSDKNYILALTMKTDAKVTSIRITYLNGLFRLDSDAKTLDRLPAFQHIMDLIQYLMEASKTPKTAKCTLKDSKGKDNLPILLLKPYQSSPSSLKNLCRITLHKHIKPEHREGFYNFVEPKVDNYLKGYPYYV